jgi:spore germination protein GerM
MAGYTVTVNLPTAGKGQEVQIPGLGTFKNGSTAEVTKEMADAFKTFQTDLGMPEQTLLEAFKSRDDVKVETANVEKPQKVVTNAPVEGQSAVVQSTDDSAHHTTDVVVDNPKKEGDK